MPKVLLVTSSTSNSLAAAATRYVQAVGNSRLINNGTETDREITWRATATLSNLFVRITANAITLASTARTRKNLANGGQSVSITALTTGAFEDTTNTDSITGSDEVDVQFVIGATGTTLTPSVVSLVCDTTTGASRIGNDVVMGLSVASTTSFDSLAGGNVDVATEVDAQLLMREAGDFNDLFVRIATNARTTSTTFAIRKNGANLGSVSVGAGLTGVFEATGSLGSVAAGDKVCWGHTTGTGTGTIDLTTRAVEWTGYAFFAMGHDFTVAALLQRFFGIGGLDNAQVTEADIKTKCRTGFMARSSYARVLSNTLSAATAITVRRNGTNALSISVPAATTGDFENTADQAQFLAADDINWSVDATGSLTGSIQISLLGVFQALAVRTGQATEADSARTLTRRKTATTGRASEADTARSVAVRKSLALGRATEVDSARPVTARKTLTIGQASETDAAQSVGLPEGTDVAQASETDVARTVGVAKTVHLGRAEETDTATALTPGQVIPVGRATESEAARPLTARKIQATGNATESDSARLIGRRKVLVLGRALSAEEARAMVARKVMAILQALEVDRALRLASPVGRATETDTAGFIFRQRNYEGSSTTSRRTGVSTKAERVGSSTTVSGGGVSTYTGEE